MVIRQQHTAKQAAQRAGFTLMEMLVVVAIIVILAGIGVPTYLSYLDSARIDAAKAGLQKIETAVGAWKAKHGQFPETLIQLAQPDPIYFTAAPLREKDLLDPWQRPYYYDSTQLDMLTQRPAIWTMGPHNDQATALRNWESN